jgi:hypothetical protein
MRTSVSELSSSSVCASVTVSASGTSASQDLSLLSGTPAVHSSASTKKLVACLEVYFQRNPEYMRSDLLERFQKEGVTLDLMVNPNHGAKSTHFRQEFGLSFGQAAAIVDAATTILSDSM